MSLVSSRKLGQLCLKQHPILFTAVRNHWNKDYKPRPYPTTQEQREAAAAKYGIPLAEYKPSEEYRGDYPDFPAVSGDSKDPTYPYDNPELKRNFNEPMHPDFDMIGEDRYDVNYKYRIPLSTQFWQFTLCMLGLGGIYYYMERMKGFIPQTPKQFPYTGKTHYMFESK